MVDKVISFDGLHGITHYTVTMENLFLDANNTLERIALIEIMAQGFAACSGYEDLEKGLPVKDGMLVAIKRFEATGTAALGDCIQVDVFRETAFGDFTTLRGHLSVKGREIARGEMRVWAQPPAIRE
jgi:predicted hotdog family 3-hydroxylacyl-ACP dehydratase